MVIDVIGKPQGPIGHCSRSLRQFISEYTIQILRKSDCNFWVRFPWLMGKTISQNRTLEAIIITNKPYWKGWKGKTLSNHKPAKQMIESPHIFAGHRPMSIRAVLFFVVWARILLCCLRRCLRNAYVATVGAYAAHPFEGVPTQA